MDYLDVFLSQAPMVYAFYANSYIFYKFLSRKEITKLVFQEFLLFASVIFLYYLISEYISPMINPKASIPETTILELMISGFWVFVRYSIFAFGYAFARQLVSKQRELRISNHEMFQLREQKLILEQDKKIQEQVALRLHQEKIILQQSHLLLEKKQIETENAYLRAQINPHFLHNTLNFFFSKSINVGAFDLADAIMVLSNVMRFSLEAKPDENGRVEVAHEMEHMKNVIKINEIRFNKAYCLDLKIDGDVENAKIIPLVLITMVENAFKYGELFDPEHPLKIHINVDGHRFRFYLHNKKRQGGAQEASHGIGVDNSIKRLTAAYGADGYAIDIQQDPVFYSVTLTIFDLARVQDDVNAVTEKVLP
jgi:two-component system, LytTR family, sensor kinase